MLDYLIQNGQVINGNGSEPVEAHVGIQGAMIAYIGNELLPAHEIIDAKGLIVSPGFIDTHAHSEFTLIADGRAEGKLSQGITTEVNGNCGLSAAPLYGEAREHREQDLEELGVKERWSTFEEYFSILENRGIAINYATLCGHGNLRASVLGYRDRVPDSTALSRMKELLMIAMKAGAKGLSTGLIYPPGMYSDTGEIVELTKVLSQDLNSACVRGATRGDMRGYPVYASHMRSEGDSIIEAVEEVMTIGRETGVHVHISHLKTGGQQNWPRIDEVLNVLERSRKEGVQLTCDRYPYVASSTDLDTTLPAWAFDGGIQEELRRLGDPAIRVKLRADMKPRQDDFWKNVFITSVITPENKWMEGKSFFDIFTGEGKSPTDALFDVLLEERTRVGAIFFSMSEDNLRRFLSLPFLMVGSDSAARCFSGPTAKGKPHPRGFGSFPRFIGHYVRHQKLMELPEAIRKATYMPATTFGLHGRGLIKEGFFADITLFDYDTILDKATFGEPFNKSEGIAYVFLNGAMALREGALTGVLAGRVLR
ncbi:MAG: N-acyl-D-amino-acid deacylase family protein [Dissulfurispiraceae bacterium]